MSQSYLNGINEECLTIIQLACWKDRLNKHEELGKHGQKKSSVSGGHFAMKQNFSTTKGWAYFLVFYDFFKGNL
jgi:hypothetical protein